MNPIEMKKIYKPNGVIKSTYDSRDYPIEKLVAKAIKLPSKYINPTPLEILDQGNVGCCVGCAGAQYKHVIEYNQTNDTTMFSPMYLYGNRRDTDYQGEGMMPREYLSNLKEFGICHKDEFDGYYEYDEAHERYLKDKTALDKLAYPFRISSYYRLWTIEDVKKAIYTTGGAFISYDVYNCMYYPNKNGVIKYDPKKDKKSLGGHQLFAFGYDEEGFYIANSWSLDYGTKCEENGSKGGIIKIPYDYAFSECWAMVDDITESVVKSKYKLTFFDKLKNLFK